MVLQICTVSSCIYILIWWAADTVVEPSR